MSERQEVTGQHGLETSRSEKCGRIFFLLTPNFSLHYTNNYVISGSSLICLFGHEVWVINTQSLLVCDTEN